MLLFISSNGLNLTKTNNQITNDDERLANDELEVSNDVPLESLSEIEMEDVKSDPDSFIFYQKYDKRHIMLNHDVGEELIEYAYDIISWNKEDEMNNIPIEDRKPIVIFINTFGGDVYSALTLMDVMKASKTPVYTVGLKAMSAGILILTQGQKRYCLNSTLCLLHSGSFGVSDCTHRAYEYVEHIKKIDNIIKKKVLENTNITGQSYDENFKNEWYFYGSEAIEYGIVDEIINDLSVI